MKNAIFGLKKKTGFLDWNYTFFHVSGGDFGNNRPSAHWPPLEEHCNDFDDLSLELDENEELIKAVTNLRMRDLQNHIRMQESID